MTLPQELTPGTWTLDMSHSEIGFSVRHAGISKVRGRFTQAEAEARVGNSLQDSSLHATVSTASFDSGDANRDGHVRGPDFFDVEKYPEMTFRGTSIEGDGEDYTLTGDLTIKGVTQPVELEVEFTGVAVDPFGATRAGFSAETEISRKSFGLTWNAALEAGGVLVSDKVKINLEAALVKQG
ncbi:YceI family protein [Pseudarthrobacter chlorophenolicus]|uniref:YceI family protein n=1 Tax=Pseudarthrobacter chlorophenolicus (strain ATCC 700700 / DSM 12829 / CIP 107037 / JCM 12360 / KCTC 9906 / NCIMB 13794 / A6) TaxID=452863 RepID=B8HDX6_PSECP|nr:YceI family protein [Pseudarthrobacter chlorophenolicus]ACL40844.1 YceI family protein [Pseudarthrobacter chlorophenolicus A6]SDQ74114.1 Polyisoprenoid-binding protein YceI [Pseudarthrobacter chlorophenolicus]